MPYISTPSRRTTSGNVIAVSMAPTPRAPPTEPTNPPYFSHVDRAGLISVASGSGVGLAPLPCRTAAPVHHQPSRLKRNGKRLRNLAWKRFEDEKRIQARRD